MGKTWRLKLKFAGLATPHWTPDIRRESPRWAELDTARPIETCELVLPPGRIYLAGYESYNFFVEASQALAGGAARIEAFYLLGRSGDICEVWRVADGQVARSIEPAGREYGGGPTRGWLPGAGGRPRSQFVRS